MISFTPATTRDIPVIRKIAYQTWPHTFGQVMPAELIDHILDLVYSHDSLTLQMTDKQHRFLIVRKDEEPLGFTSYELNYYGQPQLMIHKAYLLPSAQGTGIGTKLFNRLAETAISNDQEKLRLKVFHKNTNAIRFYEKYGFTQTGKEEVSVGKGYIVLDHVMEKRLIP